MNVKCSKGFTLIEVLVVMLIVSIVTGTALLTISRNDNKRLERAANEILQLVTLAEEQAMLQPAVLGLHIKPQHLQFVVAAAFDSDKKQSEWKTFQSHSFKMPELPENIHLSVALNPNDPEETIQKALPDNYPQIIFSTSGEVTPFTIYIGKTGEKPRYAVIGSTDGTIITKFLS